MYRVGMDRMATLCMSPRSFGTGGKRGKWRDKEIGFRGFRLQGLGMVLSVLIFFLCSGFRVSGFSAGALI